MEFALNNNGHIFTVATSSSLQTPTFHSVAGVAPSSSSASFYADGALVGSATGLTIADNTSGDTVSLGGDVTYDTWGSFAFYGAFWSRALSAAEILQLHLDPYCFLIFPEDEIFAEYVGSSAGLTAVTTLAAGFCEILGSAWPVETAAFEAPADVAAREAMFAEIPARNLGFCTSAVELGDAVKRSAIPAAETRGGLRQGTGPNAELLVGTRKAHSAAAELATSLLAATHLEGESGAWVGTAARGAAELIALTYAVTALAEAALEILSAARRQDAGAAELLAAAFPKSGSASEASRSIGADGCAAMETNAAAAARLGILVELFTRITQILQVDPRFLSAPEFRKFVSRLRRRIQASSPATRQFTSKLRLSMPQGPDFSAMDVGETVTGAIDFAAWIPSGVTIASIASVAASNYYPAGGAPYVTLVGSAQIGTSPVSRGGSGVGNAAVLQQWTGTNPGIARINVTVVTSDGQTFVGWAHQRVGQPS